MKKLIQYVSLITMLSQTMFASGAVLAKDIQTNQKEAAAVASNKQVLTLSWLSQTYQVDELELLQQLNKGYSLQDLNKVLQTKRQTGQTLDGVLNTLRPEVNAKLQQLDYSKEHYEQEQEKVKEWESIAGKPASGVTNGQAQSSSTVTNNTYGEPNNSSVTSTTYGRRMARSITNMPSLKVPSPRDTAALNRVDIKANSAPFSIGSNENISPISGDLQLEYTDMVLPGRNGLSFALKRKYNSGESNYYDKGTFTTSVMEVEYYPALTARVYNSFGDIPVTDSRGSASDFMYLRDSSGSLNYLSYVQYDGAQRRWIYPWGPIKTNDFNFMQRDKLLRENWKKVDPNDKSTALFSELYDFNGYKMTARAFPKGEVVESFKRAACATEYSGDNNSYCSSYLYATLNKVKDNEEEAHRYPIGKGWSWDIPYMALRGEGVLKRTITLFGGATYEVDGLKLVGYPWNDLTLSYDNGAYVGGMRSYYALSSINGQKQYFTREGTLIQISDAYGNNIEFIYSGTHLKTIRDAAQNEINFEYKDLEVIVSQGDRVLKYQKTKDPKENKELLSQVIDPENRKTQYVYQPTASPFDLVGYEYNVDNYHALLTQIIHPTKATTEYTYTPLKRMIGLIANETTHRVASRKEVVNYADGTHSDANYSTYIYDGAGNLYTAGDSTYRFSMLIERKNVKTTLFYEQRSFSDNFPTVYYNTEIRTESGNTVKTQKMEYNRDKRRTLPTKVTSSTKVGTQIPIEDVTLTSYDDFKNVTSQTDPNGIVTTNSYDSKTNLLSSVTQPLGPGRVSYTEIDRYPTTNGIKEVRVKEDSAAGAIKAKASYVYDSYGNPTQMTIQKDKDNSTIVDFIYPKENAFAFPKQQSVKVTNADNETQTLTQLFEYDIKTGQMTKLTDANNNVTAYLYDKLGRITKVTFPDNTTQTWTYNDAANQIQVKDPTDVQMITKWNPLGLKEEEGIVGKPHQSYGYDAYGRMIWSEAPSDQPSKPRTTMTYDNWDRLLTTTSPSPDLAVSSISYDDVNRTKTVTDGESNRAVETYDRLGRTVKKQLFNKENEVISSTDYSYDYGNNVVTVKDGVDGIGNGVNTTSNTYDVLGRLLTVTDAEQNTTSYTYDMSSNLTQIEYPDKNKATKTYDQLGRIIRSTDPLGQAEVYYYDLNGNMVKKLDRKGQQHTFTYNNRDLQISSAVGNETVTFIYDAAGRRKTMKDATGETGYTYDPTTGWLTQVKFPDTRTIGYEYDNTGKRTKMTDPFGIVTVYGYDNQNRLSGIGSAANDWEATYNYKKNSLTANQTLKNGVKSVWEYNGLNARSLTHMKPAGQSEQLTYTYDLHGNQISKFEGANLNFTYDKLNRIDTSSQFNEDYAYDNRGNRSTLQSNNTPSLASLNYQYDGRNQLSQVSLESGATIGYKYNGDGLMTERTDNGITTRYYYDGTSIIAEGTVSGSAVTHKASYIRGKGLVARVDANGSRAYYTHNGHGDVTELRSSTGELLNSYAYDIWGNPTVEQEKVPNPFRYSGEFWDGATKLQYLRARWYDPGVGRFINQDTYEGDINNPLTLNLYTYVTNNPLTNWDPTGRCNLGDEKCDSTYSSNNYADQNGILRLNGTGEVDYEWYLNWYTNDTIGFIQASKENRHIASVGGTVAAMYIARNLAKTYAEASLGKGAKVKSKSSCNCFASGTKVVTDEGEKNIEDIEVGDKVLAKDEFNPDGELAYKEVTALYRNQRDDIIKLHVGEQIIETTDNHPFWVEGKGWVFADELQVGDKLQKADGSNLTIDKVEFVKLDEKVTVYNFTVADYHTYYVTDIGIWVHNTNCNTLRSQGNPYENHTTVKKTDTVRSLQTTGKPNSSVDFYDENGTLMQRRYYDENGRAIQDIDYEHSNGDNSHDFPHSHTWDWSSGSPKRSK